MVVETTKTNEPLGTTFHECCLLKKANETQNIHDNMRGCMSVCLNVYEEKVLCVLRLLPRDRYSVAR